VQGEFQTQKEAAWAISNLTISGRKDQVSSCVAKVLTFLKAIKQQIELQAVLCPCHQFQGLPEALLFLAVHASTTTTRLVHAHVEYDLRQTCHRRLVDMNTFLTPKVLNALCKMLQLRIFHCSMMCFDAVGWAAGRASGL